MTILTIVGLIFGAIVLITLLLGIAYLASIAGSRFFGDDPGGRNPDLTGQFHLWGTGPDYIEFLREKRKLRKKKRRS